MDQPIAELKTSHSNNVSYSLLELSRKGMWDYAYKKHPEEMKFLAKNGYLEILERAYTNNESVAASEMSAFSKKFNCEEVREAPFLTYVLQHAFIRSAFFLKELRKESTVNVDG